MSGLHLDLGPTVGALQIAINISGILFGALCIQAYVYYRIFPNDSKVLKYFVAGVWILELGQHIASTHAVYQMSVTEWGNPIALFIQPKTITASFFLGPLITPLVETFYLSRIYRFSGQLYLALFVLLMVWLRYAGWVFLAVQEYKIGFTFLDHWSWLLITLLTLGAAVDALIALAMAYYLYQRRDSAFLQTTRLIDRLIMWTIQTGFITSVTFLVTLITYLTMPKTLIWMSICACVTKIFSNCLLATLNARSTTKHLEDDSLQLTSNNIPKYHSNMIPPVIFNISHNASLSEDHTITESRGEDEQYISRELKV